MASSGAYPCDGMMISSPYTRTCPTKCRILDQRTGPLRLAVIAIIRKTSDWTGKVVAEPCEANFLSLKKSGGLEISSLIHLVRAACKARSKEGLPLNMRSTVQHVRRSLAEDKSTVASDRSKELFTTISDERS